MKAPFVQYYPEPPINRREILRYAGMRTETPEVAALLNECLKKTVGKIVCRVCWREYGFSAQENELDLGFARVCSADLAKALTGCSRVILFAATIGLDMDRLIAREGRLSPAGALMMQAIGTERVESLCDAFCRDTAERASKEGLRLTTRFSPGYGDLPLGLQTDIFAALNCSRWIGLTMNASLLMLPTKSVTAIIGMGKCAEKSEYGCAACQKKDCMCRRNL